MADFSGPSGPTQNSYPSDFGNCDLHCGSRTLTEVPYGTDNPGVGIDSNGVSPRCNGSGLPAGTELIRWLFLLEVVAVSALLSATRIRKRSSLGNRAFRNAATRIGELFNVKCVILGHTHETDLWNTKSGFRYFNAGTWTKVFSQEDQVLREEREFTFVRVIKTSRDLDARLMKWEGGSRSARPIRLFRD